MQIAESLMQSAESLMQSAEESLMQNFREIFRKSEKSKRGTFEIRIFLQFLFFLRIGRSDLTKKLEKVGPFECDELEKHCRVSAKCYPTKVPALYTMTKEKFKILAKIGSKNQQFLQKIQQTFCNINVAQFAIFCHISKMSAR